MLRLEVLTPEMERLAPVLCGSLSGMPFTLAGGTALALQLGHRVSVDFDWFFSRDILPFQIGERFAALKLGFTPIQDTAHTFECLLAGVRCSFFSFRSRFEPASVSLHGMPLAPVPDIAAMKLVAVSQRGARKDFYDLFEIPKGRALIDIACRLRIANGFALLVDCYDGRKVTHMFHLMGGDATASIGAVIAHHQTPLARVLADLRRAEKRAKGEGGRDALFLAREGRIGIEEKDDACIP